MAVDKFVVFGFEANLVPWHETYGLAGVADMNTAQDHAVKMLKQRLLLMGNGVKCTGIRISEYPDFNRVIRQVLPSDGQWQDPPAVDLTSDAENVERASSVVLIRMFDAVGKVSNRPLSGAPDTLHSESNAGGLRTDRVPGWLTNFQKWRRILINDPVEPDRGPWAFPILDPASEAAANKILEGDVDPLTGFLQVLVAGNHTATYPVGTEVRVKGNRRILAGFTSPNGDWTVSDVSFDAGTNKTSITLQGATGIDPERWLPGSYGKIFVQSFTLTLVKDVKIVRSSVRQRRFQGFNQVPGRGRAKKGVT